MANNQGGDPPMPPQAQNQPPQVHWEPQLAAPRPAPFRAFGVEQYQRPPPPQPQPPQAQDQPQVHWEPQHAAPRPAPFRAYGRGRFAVRPPPLAQLYPLAPGPRPPAWLQGAPPPPRPELAHPRPPHTRKRYYCKFLRREGHCDYGPFCAYAHSREELQNEYNHPANPGNNN